MLNKYPLWKNLMVALFALFGFVYAIPNLYPDDPAVQITAAKAGADTSQAIVDTALAALKEAGIETKDSELDERSALIRFKSGEAQVAALSVVRDALQKTYPGTYVVAMNLAPTTPEWLQKIGAAPMRLGLDLRGGVHFLMEVDMDRAVDTRLGNAVGAMRERFREAGVFAKLLRKQPDAQAIEIVLAGNAKVAEARDIVRKEFRDFVVEESASGDDVRLRLTYSEQALKDIQNYAIDQNLTSIRNRVNELGVSEAVVARQGLNRIVIQLPGVQDTAEAKRTIGKAANLEFRLVDWENDVMTMTRVPAGSELHTVRNSPRQVLLKRENIVTGENVIDARPNYDQNGQPMVSVTLDNAGGKRMLRTTTAHVKDQMAVLFIESKPETREVIENGQRVVKTITRDFKEAISVATIQGVFGSQFQITGLDSYEEAKELALLMRAGALAAPMYFVEERTLGPTLGAQNIEAGINSLILGFVLVLVFMVLVYKVFGLAASLALLMNLFLLVACMSLLPGAVLTLPGMAGIVLTLGMAVDANVLIFERIKEELRNGLPIQSAIHAGFDRAWLTILDSNLTTLFVGIVLFSLGAGSVKGFAVTLCIGIVTSMFTSVVGSRAIINLIYGGRSVKKLSI